MATTSVRRSAVTRPVRTAERAIGETSRHIGGNANCGALGRPDESHAEHAADQILVVVATAGNVYGGTEDVDKEEYKDEGLDGDTRDPRPTRSTLPVCRNGVSPARSTSNVGPNTGLIHTPGGAVRGWCYTYDRRSLRPSGTYNA